MPDSHVEDNIVFLGWKVFNSDNFYMFSCSRNAQLKIICFPNYKIIFNSNLIRAFKSSRVFKGLYHLCMEDHWNYDYSPFDRQYFKIKIILSQYQNLEKISWQTKSKNNLHSQVAKVYTRAQCSTMQIWFCMHI